MSRKRIVFFVTSLQSGGIENYLLRFIRMFSTEFEKITVFCKSGQGGQLENQYLEFKNVSIVKRKIGYYSLNDYKYLHKFFSINDYTGICDFTGNFAGLIQLIAKYNKIDKRITFYRNSSNRFKGNRLKNLYNAFSNGLTYRYSTKILANSKAALDFYFPNKWIGKSKFSVIYNGVSANDFVNTNGDLRLELGIPQDAFVVGHTGRYNAAKNHRTILSVATELTRSFSDIYFIMCGNGVKINLSEEVNSKGLTEKIKLFENRSDISKFLNTMDCFYFPSLTEGQPNSLIEAMISGLPIVASDIAPIKETMPNSFHNSLVSPLDSDRAVLEILKIYNGHERRSGLKNWAISKFDASELFRDFYEQL